MCVCRTSVTPSGNTTRTCLARMNWLTLSFRVRRKGRNGLRKIISSFGCSALHFPQATGAAVKPRGSVLKIPCSDRHQFKTPFGSNEEHRNRGASTCRHIQRKAYPPRKKPRPTPETKKGLPSRIARNPLPFQSPLASWLFRQAVRRAHTGGLAVMVARVRPSRLMFSLPASSAADDSISPSRGGGRRHERTRNDS